MSEVVAEELNQGLIRPELLQVADAVARDKNIDREIVVHAMEQAIQTASRRKYGQELEIRAEIDRVTGEIRLARIRQVVEDVEDDATEINVEKAIEIDPTLAVGGELAEPLPPIDLGRVAAQAAKQVIVQRVREAERARDVCSVPAATAARAAAAERAALGACAERSAGSEAGCEARARHDHRDGDPGAQRLLTSAAQHSCSPALLGNSTFRETTLSLAPFSVAALPLPRPSFPASSFPLPRFVVVLSRSVCLRQPTSLCQRLSLCARSAARYLATLAT